MHSISFQLDEHSQDCFVSFVGLSDFISEIFILLTFPDVQDLHCYHQGQAHKFLCVVVDCLRDVDDPNRPEINKICLFICVDID